ncbi:hypothetical protein PY254_17215 [Rhodanobacter sp. AS-Z3]|uniref:hypothetical protein n=1 Tax=Rhodanobacter sp. AS-Z3 TaxID=3031330 RepID=UPI00247A6C52|nr:hypothetical protein [Rhodanobacter sp. AS-Z3]WEN14946.1 hypothetical protein PY254_17215 [Rhodanobacter sp. AS-Z3]
MNMQSVEMNARVDRVLELTVVGVLAVSGIGLLATLTGHFLAPQILLAATLLTGLYAWRAKAVAVAAGGGPKWTHVVLLLLVCLFFRLPAFNYVLGGQDEGVYVNMAHYIERTGGIDAQDTVLEKLQGTPYVDRYLSENRHIRAYSGPLKGGDFVSGVYINGPADIGLSFQFYHLFPIWMALFSGIFGGAFAVYALTFFALLSVVFMHRLTLALTDSPRAALIAGLLLALNPLHAFFSKFPVTEVPTLAFSLIGFTYLALFWRAADGLYNRRWLLLSMLSFGALFAVRISGFMYIPFFVALAVASATVDTDRLRQRAIQFWVLGVSVLYAMSVVYGLHWSGQYSRDIYRMSFEPIFSHHWQAWLAVIVLLGLVVWLTLVVLAQGRRRVDVERFVVSPTRRLVGLVVAAGLVLGIYKIYQLGWTSRFAGDPTLDSVWRLVGSHWGALQSSSLATLFVYLGPILPLAFLGLALRRQSEPSHEFLRLFAAGFLVYVLLLQWVVPYGPYYARYVLSEVVPYMLLFTVIVWAGMPRGSVRRMLSITLAITMIYSAGVTAAQLGQNESEGLYQSLSQLLAPVGSTDVVLLDTLGPGLPNDSELKTPIKFIFGLPAVTVSQASLDDWSYVGALNARYDDVFMVSSSSKPPAGFEFVNRTRIKVKAYEWNHSFPHKTFLREDMDLYLYRLATPIFPLGYEVSFAAPGAWNNWLASGWSTPENLGVWSNGLHAEIAIDARQLPHVKHDLRFSFKVVGLVTQAYPKQRVQVSMNGVASSHLTVTYPEGGAQLQLDVPASDLDALRKIHIDFYLPDATTPKALGINGDERVLGIRLEALTISPIDLNSPTPSATQAPVIESPVQGKHHRH